MDPEKENEIRNSQVTAYEMELIRALDENRIEITRLRALCREAATALGSMSQDVYEGDLIERLKKSTEKNN